MSAPSPARQLFAEAVRVPDEELDVARVALLLAVEDDPDWAVESGIVQLDQLAADLPDDLKEQSPNRQAERVATYLHEEQGFHGDRQTYYSPANSLLTQVLARRMGIPLTLALVYMEVARRRGIVLLPIGLPGHLVLRHADDRDVYVDPFRGTVHTEEACLEQVLETQDMDRLAPEMLEPLGRRPFLLRMLNNLKGAYLRAEPPNIRRALAASERIMLVYPEAYTELRDRGLLHLQLGERIAALEYLERYLDRVPEAQDASKIRAQSQALYQFLSRLN